MSSSISEIPVIDLQNFPSQSQALIDACVSWGCFRVINHRISMSLMSDMKSIARALLDLPLEIKCRNDDREKSGTGYVKPNKASLLYESLSMHDSSSAATIDKFCTHLDVSIQQRETIVKYIEDVHDLAMEIGRKIGEGMGLGGDLLEGWRCHFRVNKYNFTQETVGSTGAYTHTDTGFVTILQDDEKVNGLEVMHPKTGEFVEVDPMPGSFLVNLGDIGKIWSNGKFNNVKHRVQCKEGAVRVSILLLVLGPRDKAVEAPPELVGPKNPRLYVPVVPEDYFNLRNSTLLRAGETLAMISSSANSREVEE